MTSCGPSHGGNVNVSRGRVVVCLVAVKEIEYVLGVAFVLLSTTACSQRICKNGR